MDVSTRTQYSGAETMNTHLVGWFAGVTIRSYIKDFDHWIAFVNCLIGTQLGKRFGHLFENKLEIIGGIVLVLIGLKILFEHLVKNI